MARSDHPLIWNSMFVYEVEFSSFIRGHHVYEESWSPESLWHAGKMTLKNYIKNTMNTQLGLTLKPSLEADNKYVGRVPMGLSFLIFPIFIFLKLAKAPIKVTGSKRIGKRTCCPWILPRQNDQPSHDPRHKIWKGKGRGSFFASLHNLLSLSTPSTKVGRGLYEWEQQLQTPGQFLKVFFSSKQKKLLILKGQVHS